jgi:hypothetical protein
VFGVRLLLRDARQRFGGLRVFVRSDNPLEVLADEQGAQEYEEKQDIEGYDVPVGEVIAVADLEVVEKV